MNIIIRIIRVSSISSSSSSSSTSTSSISVVTSGTIIINSGFCYLRSPPGAAWASGRSWSPPRCFLSVSLLSSGGSCTRLWKSNRTGQPWVQTNGTGYTVPLRTSSFWVNRKVVLVLWCNKVSDIINQHHHHHNYEIIAVNHKFPRAGFVCVCAS